MRHVKFFAAVAVALALAVVIFVVVAQQNKGDDAPDGIVQIPGGWFTMGCSPRDGKCYDSERPSKRVHVDAFFIDTHEVTQAEY